MLVLGINRKVGYEAMNTAMRLQARKLVSFSASAFAEMAAEAIEPRLFERDGHQVLEYKDVPVFRSGTFRDSMGIQATYTEADMRAFVDNYTYLVSSGIFPDAPVRKGHPQFGVSHIDTVVGYLTGLRTEERTAKLNKGTFNVLLATYEILDGDAIDKCRRKLWRNRSSEIGTYRDNNDVERGPAFMGFAFVDIPAVEHLNEFSKNAGGSDAITFTHYTEEIDMTVQNGLTTPPAPVPAPPAPAPVPAAPVSFSIGGVASTDYAAVQAYITALEKSNADLVTAESNRTMSEREAYVKGLASGDAPKIPATMIDANLALVKGLDAASYSTWKTTMDSMPENPLFAQHGGSAGASSTPPATPEAPADAEFATAKAIVERLAKSGVNEESVKATAAFAKVIAKEPGYTLPRVTAYSM